MRILKLDGFVFQINLVKGFKLLDCRGEVLRTVLNFGDFIITGSDSLQIQGGDHGEYNVDPLSFFTKLPVAKINSLLVENPDEIESYVEEQLKFFISKSRELYKILGIDKIKRVACRFAAFYKDPDEKTLLQLFTRKELRLDSLKNIDKKIRIDGAVIAALYDKEQNILKLDLDSYENGEEFSIDRIEEKYSKVLRPFNRGIDRPQKMVDAFYG